MAAHKTSPQISTMAKLITLLRGHFFTGLFIFIPIGVITWIAGKVLALLWGIQKILPEAWRPESFISDSSLVFLLKLTITTAAILILLFGISFLGWISKQYIGQKVLEWIAELIQHIPVLRSVYTTLDQLFKAMAPGGEGKGHQFSRVVYIEYPRKGVWAIAFVTGPARGIAVPKKHLNVFLPATPNPTSGFHLIVSEDEVIETQMKVEDAFKTILSLGIAQPGA